MTDTAEASHARVETALSLAGFTLIQLSSPHLLPSSSPSVSQGGPARSNDSCDHPGSLMNAESAGDIVFATSTIRGTISAIGALLIRKSTRVWPDGLHTESVLEHLQEFLLDTDPQSSLALNHRLTRPAMPHHRHRHQHVEASRHDDIRLQPVGPQPGARAQARARPSIPAGHARQEQVDHRQLASTGPDPRGCSRPTDYHRTPAGPEAEHPRGREHTAPGMRSDSFIADKSSCSRLALRDLAMLGHLCAGRTATKATSREDSPA